jgi:hypothetical protein
VGQDEDSLSSVGGANVGRSKSSPLRIEPERVKVGKHNVESANNES